MIRSSLRNSGCSTLLALPVALAVVITTGCGAAPPRAVAPAPDPVAAIVNDTVILRAAVVARARPWLAQGGTTARGRILRDTLDRMIDEVLIERQAVASSSPCTVTVAWNEVDQGIDHAAASHGQTRDAFLARATGPSLSVEEFRDEVRRQVLEARMLELHVAPRMTRDPNESPEQLADHLAKARRNWLDGLRRASFVEVHM